MKTLSAYGIYQLYLKDRCREMVKEIDLYGMEFWHDLQGYLTMTNKDDRHNFLVYADIVKAYFYNKSR
jgi:hypothetical protein